MASSRFGASKFRNSVPYLVVREEWYRTSLPPSSSTTSSATSSFSSEIKTDRQLLVTLTPGGDLSWRKYDAFGSGAIVGSGKVGGGGAVGDWDLGKVEGGEIVIGALDGTISLHQLRADNTTLSPPSYTASASASPITSISLHPTVPSIILSSSISHPATIWNFTTSPKVPSIELEAKEPKGMWSLAWSIDGRLVAGIGKSGTAYVWDPRSSAQPTMTRVLPIQSLKPARVTWVGEDLFVTSTSKMRNREYHLFSTSKSLATIFTQNIDTSTAPLIPTVDQERRIVYLAGKGDMTLRQVELSGPKGYQETLHSLPYAISGAGLALASPTSLPVMQAQIATVMVPVVDKDGDSIIPFGIRVPRRQLIDFHEDLYPEVKGFLPESSASEWFGGSDKSPLSISLDPARRSDWEAELGRYSASARSASNIGDLPLEKLTSSISSAPTDTKSTEFSTPDPIASSPENPQTEASAAAPAVSSNPAQGETRASNVPPVEGDETYSSTTYKARIIAQHIKKQLENHRQSGSKAPMFVGLQGPQGCGKTTLCDGFVAYLSEKMSIKAAVLSLDDLYHTNANLEAVAAKHPNNHLLSGRGPPGTHDTELAKSVLSSVSAINTDSSSVELPIFDKSLCGGEGDRSERTISVKGPIDVFILEGWSMGFAPLTPARLAERYSSRPSDAYFSAHSLEALTELNDYLQVFSAAVYPFFSSLITVVPTSYEHVFSWRLEQERAMKAANGGKGMSDEQVRKFVERYMPGYELWREGIWDRGWSGLELKYGKGREVLGVEHQEGKPIKEEQSTSASTAPRAPSAPSAPASVPQASTTPAKSSSPTPAPSTSATLASKPQPLPTTTSGTSSASRAPFNPSYSRKFLAAKAPLIPTYDQLPPLASLHPDSIVLKCTRHLAFFPIQGPGGRLGVHPLSKKGRMPNGGQGYLSGGVEIADFAVEPFERSEGARVAIAGDDGVIRIWTIGKDGVEGPGPSPGLTLKGQGIDKIVQVAFHPTAKDLLVAATNDHTSSSIRFFDLSIGKEANIVPIDVKGIFNFSINPDGNLFAIASKDGRIIILDPRTPDNMRAGKAHDSPRSFQLSWISPTHIISVGFNRGSQRRINLYSLESSSVETIHSMMIDISPSVLFPSYDPDTRILYIWGKGERVISAYEVNIDHRYEPISKLPTYNSGEAQMGVSFKRKTEADVRKVEIMKALRMTGKTIEEVTFSIPRNKPEFFQDDIFIDTVDTEFAVNTATEWLAGKDSDPKYISLRPEGMTPLSEAPKVTTAAKAKFVPGAEVLSEEEKKRREMDALFNKAKADESSDEEVEVKGLAPPDDDW